MACDVGSRGVESRKTVDLCAHNGSLTKKKNVIVTEDILGMSLRHGGCVEKSWRILARGTQGLKMRATATRQSYHPPKNSNNASEHLCCNENPEFSLNIMCIFSVLSFGGG